MQQSPKKIGYIHIYIYTYVTYTCNISYLHIHTQIHIATVALLYTVHPLLRSVENGASSESGCRCSSEAQQPSKPKNNTISSQLEQHAAPANGQKEDLQEHKACGKVVIAKSLVLRGWTLKLLQG